MQRSKNWYLGDRTIRCECDMSISKQYFIIFFISKHHYRARTIIQLLCHEMADFIIAFNLWLPSISALFLLITESWQCYRSEPVNKPGEVSRSWGNVWLTVGPVSSRRSLIKRLIGGDLGWEIDSQRWTVWILIVQCNMLLYTGLHIRRLWPKWT